MRKTILNNVERHVVSLRQRQLCSLLYERPETLPTSRPSGQLRASMHQQCIITRHGF